MRRICFVRHATARDKDESLPDFERSLVKKGEKEASAVAGFLSLRQAPPDLMVSSFANRAVETAHVFAGILGYSRQKVLLRDSLYSASAAGDLIGEIRTFPDEYESLMLFGHDPVLSRLAADLVPEFSGELPKAGVIVAEFPAGRWRDLETGSGKLLEFIDPSRIKALRKAARAELEARLVRSMNGVLARAHREGALVVRAETRKAAHKLAKVFLAALSGKNSARPGNSGRRAG